MNLQVPQDFRQRREGSAIDGIKDFHLEFFFPTPSHESETGEIDLINGDVPRIIVKASQRVQVDQVEKEDRKKKNREAENLRE